MRRLALAALTVLTFGAGQTPQPTVGETRFSAGDAQIGRVIYSRYCTACHGALGKGDGVLASQLIRRPIDLTQLSKKNGGAFPFERVRASIDGRKTPRAHGTTDMPVWGDVFALTEGSESPDPDTAVKRVTQFVWSLQPKIVRDEREEGAGRLTPVRLNDAAFEP